MSKSGVFLLLVLAGLVASWLVWTYLPFPDVTDRQVIVLTAVLAAAIALWGIFSQRAITRRQVTIEHIRVLQSDGDLIRARLKFRQLARDGNLAQWATADNDQSAEAQAITTLLNEFELISIGIQRGIIDFEIYKRWYKSGAVRVWNDAQPFVLALRQRLNNPAIFHEFEEMVRWFNDNAMPRRGWIWGRVF